MLWIWYEKKWVNKDVTWERNGYFTIDVYRNDSILCNTHIYQQSKQSLELPCETILHTQLSFQWETSYKCSSGRSSTASSAKSRERKDSTHAFEEVMFERMDWFRMDVYQIRPFLCNITFMLTQEFWWISIRSKPTLQCETFSRNSRVQHGLSDYSSSAISRERIHSQLLTNEEVKLGNELFEVWLDLLCVTFT